MTPVWIVLWLGGFRPIETLVYRGRPIKALDYWLNGQNGAWQSKSLSTRILNVQGFIFSDVPCWRCTWRPPGYRAWPRGGAPSGCRRLSCSHHNRTKKIKVIEMILMVIGEEKWLWSVHTYLGSIFITLTSTSKTSVLAVFGPSSSSSSSSSSN